MKPSVDFYNLNLISLCSISKNTYSLLPTGSLCQEATGRAEMVSNFLRSCDLHIK